MAHKSRRYQRNYAGRTTHLPWKFPARRIPFACYYSRFLLFYAVYPSTDQNYVDTLLIFISMYFKEMDWNTLFYMLCCIF